MVYILPSLAPPAVQLPSHERLQQWWERFITITLWAIAVTYTAGRLARIGFEWARPYLAKALHALALSLDGGLEYPDQPEPEPTDPCAKADCLHGGHSPARSPEPGEGHRSNGLSPANTYELPIQ